MHILGKLSVLPRIPAALSGLHELARNLWWVWNPPAQALFAQLDAALWEQVGHNPIAFLTRIEQGKLDAAAANPTYMAAYESVMGLFANYLKAEGTWSAHTAHTAPALSPDRPVAYFSAEFGLHESLPIYSGGLGILSGDHCKAASDLGIPFVAVGLLYNQGYFRQRLNASGWQEAIYEKLDFSQTPIQEALDADGRPVMVGVDLPGRTVYAKVWQIKVGRITICLLDTDVEANSLDDRRVSAQLYGGDQEMRIAQEMILGIGGVRALRALGIRPSVYHLNEGHSAFLTLELSRELIHAGLAFAEAREAVSASCVFTTHTPVPAGNDAFGFELMDRFFGSYWPRLGLDRETFLDLGREQVHGQGVFSMTVLAIKMSRFANGVSALHGEVSRSMWAGLWPDVAVTEVPITSITNGVHVPTWLAPDLATLYDEYLGSQWRYDAPNPASWAAVDQIPDAKLWETHAKLKREMVDFVRERVGARRLRIGETPARVRAAEQLLDPKALTIGFARRFATYKRAGLLFRDLERLKRIVNHADRPVQFIFAGKAHPADQPGKEVIQQIYEWSRLPELAGKIVVLEDYDMAMARHLVQGVDVWLNNPRRPLEASGTSGQKAALNGVPNLSVLDGWWVEGYDGANGWAIGEAREYRDQDAQDDADSNSLYELLEAVIAPLYYTEAHGSGQGWQSYVKQAIRSCAGRFSANRMVRDYTERAYRPAAEAAHRFAEHGYAMARDLAGWRARIRRLWAQVYLEADAHLPAQLTVGEPLKVTARLRSGVLTPDELRVDLVIKREDLPGEPRLEAVEMRPTGQHEGWQYYEGAVTPDVGGTFGYAVRVRPWHHALGGMAKLETVRWAVPKSADVAQREPLRV